MASLKSWTTVVVIVALGLSVLLAASPEARQQTRQGAEQIGTVMVQIFVGIGDLFKSLFQLNVNSGTDVDIRIGSGGDSSP